MSFLQELASLREKAILDSHNKAKEEFKTYLYNSLQSMQSSVENEFRRLVVRDPHLTQYIVQRTFREFTQGMCDFFHATQQEQHDYEVSLGLLYPSCILSLKESPPHRQRFCEDADKSNHTVRVVFTILLPQQS